MVDAAPAFRVASEGKIHKLSTELAYTTSERKVDSELKTEINFEGVEIGEKVYRV